MKKIYTFDTNQFNKKFLPESLIIFAILAVCLNVLAIQHGNWNVVVEIVFVAIVGLPIVGVYIQQKTLWKQAYIELNETGVKYYRKAKEGYADGVTTYIFEESVATICAISRVSVKGNKMYIEGTIDVQTYMDKDHTHVRKTSLQQIKIPMYFNGPDDLLLALKRYY